MFLQGMHVVEPKSARVGLPLASAFSRERDSRLRELEGEAFGWPFVAGEEPLFEQDAVKFSIITVIRVRYVNLFLSMFSSFYPFSFLKIC